MKTKSGNHQYDGDGPDSYSRVLPRRSEPVVCQVCRGTGEVEPYKVPFTYWDDCWDEWVTDYEEDTQCKVCQGLGEIDVEKK